MIITITKNLASISNEFNVTVVFINIEVDKEHTRTLGFHWYQVPGKACESFGKQAWHYDHTRYVSNSIEWT